MIKRRLLAVNGYGKREMAMMAVCMKMKKKVLFEIAVVKFNLFASAYQVACPSLNSSRTSSFNSLIAHVVNVDDDADVMFVFLDVGSR